MTTRKSRLRVALATVTAGMMFQFVAPLGTTSGGCAQFGLQFAAATFDACAVLNCTEGSFFNFCSPTRLLADCPGTTEETP